LCKPCLLGCFVRTPARSSARRSLCCAWHLGTRNPTLQMCYMFLGSPLNVSHLPTKRLRFEHTLFNTQLLLIVFVRMILGFSSINSLNPNEKNMSAKWYIFKKSTKDHHQIQLGVWICCSGKNRRAATSDLMKMMICPPYPKGVS